jgi:hypothetical protein
VLPVVSVAVTVLEPTVAALGTEILRLKDPSEETVVVLVVPANVTVTVSAGTKLVPATVTARPAGPVDGVNVIASVRTVQVLLLVTPLLSVIVTVLAPLVNAGTLQVAASLPPVSMLPWMAVAETPPNFMDAMVTLPPVLAVKPPPWMATALYESPLLGVIVSANVAALAGPGPGAIGRHTTTTITNSQAIPHRLFILVPSSSGGMFPTYAPFLM